MNKGRRKKLQKAMKLLEQAKEIIEAEKVEGYIYTMEEVCDGILDVIDTIEEIVEGEQ